MSDLTEDQEKAVDHVVLTCALMASERDDGAQSLPAQRALDVVIGIFNPFMDRPAKFWERMLAESLQRLTARGLLRYEPPSN